MSQYPPPKNLQNPRGHRSSTSSSSNANTFVAHGGGNTRAPSGAFASAEGTRRSNHRPKPSSFSMTSTLVGNQHGGAGPPLTQSNSRTTQHRRSKSGSSSSKGPETSLRPLPAAAIKTQLPPTPAEPSLSKVSPISRSTISRNTKSSDSSCCGVVQESAARAREERYGPNAGTKPQPWIVLKLMVGVTLGLIGYSAYVYVGLLVVPMLKEKRGAVGSRTTGIGLLVGFGIVWLWTVWAYCKVIFTPPGFARDHVPKTEKPSNTGPPLSFAPQLPPMTRGSSRLALGVHDPEQGLFHPRHGIGGPSYEDMSTMLAPPPTIPRPTRVDRTTSNTTVRSVPMSINSGAGSTREGRYLGANASDSESEVDGDERNRSRASVSLRDMLQDTDGGGNATRSRKLRKQRGGSGLAKGILCCWWLASENTSRPSTYIARRPPTTPVLDPLYRYCEKDGFVKPYRTHHCRSCGTCVLKYDHHCPWIGQCVGARNHKFFLNFCQAAFVCAVYMIGTLLPYTIKGFSEPDLDVNPQQLIIVALSALFALFTYALMMSHIYMIMLGQTTVEHMHIVSMKEREEGQLAKAFKWWEFRGKAQTLREWDREWGALPSEGHIWWIGGRRREWEAVMGKNPLGWILPIGKSEGNGLDYLVNPRFDSDGRWRRREDWPVELR